MTYNWIAFDPDLKNKQPLPPESRYVLVAVPDRWTLATVPMAVVGYLTYFAGYKDMPCFTIPGPDHWAPSHWCDCLGDDFVPMLPAKAKDENESHS